MSDVKKNRFRYDGLMVECEYKGKLTDIKPTLLLLSTSLRRIENLKAILRSLPGEWSIAYAGDLSECREIISPDRPVMVIIDSTLEDEIAAQTITEIRRVNGSIWILKLAAYPREFPIKYPDHPDVLLLSSTSSGRIIDEVLKAAAHFGWL